MARVRRVTLFFILVARKWREDRAPRMAAALAFYTLFSLAPLAVILLALIGRFLGARQVMTELLQPLEGFVGAEADSLIRGVADSLIRSIVENATQSSSITIATLIGVLATLWGASNVFNHLYETLNIVWGVKPEPSRGTLRHFVRRRLLSFGVVLFAGALLVIYVVANTVVPLLVQLFEQLLTTTFLSELVPADLLARIVRVLDTVQISQYVAAFLVLILMLAIFFRILPDVQIAWRHVWVGALFTAVLISAGTLAMGIYFRYSSLNSVYGAAGSVMVILAWFYYVSQIFLFGAEFTEVYTRWYGGHIEPADYAVSVEEEHSLKAELEEALPEAVFRLLVDENNGTLDQVGVPPVDRRPEDVGRKQPEPGD